MEEISGPLVVVTGGTGFLGSQIIFNLLEARYRVRAVVRAGKTAIIQETYSNRVQTFEVDDISTSDLTGCFKDAQMLIHAATPTPKHSLDTKSTVIGAIKATENVVSEALKSGVTNIVFTSSIAAQVGSDMHLLREDITIDDTWWSKITLDMAMLTELGPIHAYYVSKSFAEKRFWELIEARPDVNGSSIILPWIYGASDPKSRQYTAPINSNTNFIVHCLIEGSLQNDRSILRYIGPVMTDIYDAAKVHIRALESKYETTKRKRLICFGDQFEWIEAIKLIKAERPALQNRLIDDPDCQTRRAKKFCKIRYGVYRESVGYEEGRLCGLEN